MMKEVMESSDGYYKEKERKFSLVYKLTNRWRTVSKTAYISSPINGYSAV